MRWVKVMEKIVVIVMGVMGVMGSKGFCIIVAKEWYPLTIGCTMTDVFKWQPLLDYNQELYANVSEIACSPESTLFAASDVDGNVKIYNYHLDTCGKCILSFRLSRSRS